MAIVPAIRTAAAANVILMPAATAARRAAVMSTAAEAHADTAPMTEAPVINPRLRERLSMPETTPRWPGCARAPPIAAAVAEPEEDGIGGGFEFDPIDA